MEEQFTVVMKHSGSLITLRSSEGWRMFWNSSLICVKGLLIKGDKIVRVSRVKKQYTTIKLATDWKNVEVFEPFIFRSNTMLVDFLDDAN